ncbi:C2 domain protein [Ancylostoma ceylanicum]|uniref:C2 domain protein n=1 Tax=Ancylostoma ceylanicum TaxID=53326 RepID=A0A0D6M2J6_9BILA|nr:C2 domain protein [Ancylostoma ceylanicum]
MYFVPRLYEVHEVTTTWQLRCYFLWAKDLLPVAKNSARAFVRVTFLTRALQTLVVENSQNPVWNETLIFEKFLSIRRPFLELIIGDTETQTDPIENVVKDPNFETPLITFPRKEEAEESNWTEYEKYMEAEDEALASTPLIPSLRREGMPNLDWWSKYYASDGHPEKAPGFEESGIEYLTIFKEPLEYVNNYNGFEDFLDTFNFVKSSSGNFDDPEEKEKTGELKGKVFITRVTENTDDNEKLSGRHGGANIWRTCGIGSNNSAGKGPRCFGYG